MERTKEKKDMEQAVKNKIAAVVVTYNRKELLRQCIQRLLDQKGISCDILLIDNASTDGTAEMVKKEFSSPQVIYQNTGSNLGGAGGFQLGIKKAAEIGYEYVWIMDDDTFAEETALSALMEADRELKGNWGFLSSVVYWTDGNICRRNIPKKTIFQHVEKKDYQEKFVPVEMGSFVSLFVKTSVIREVGLPIKEYFIWTDDYEFTGRISRKYRGYAVRESCVIHATPQNTRVDFATDSADRLERYHYIYRNDVHCYKQYGIKGWFYIISKNMYTIMNILLRSKEEKGKKIGIVLKGMWEGIHFQPEIEMKIEG